MEQWRVSTCFSVRWIEDTVEGRRAGWNNGTKGGGYGWKTEKNKGWKWEKGGIGKMPRVERVRVYRVSRIGNRCSSACCRNACTFVWFRVSSVHRARYSRFFVFIIFKKRFFFNVEILFRFASDITIIIITENDNYSSYSSIFDTFSIMFRNMIPEDSTIYSNESRYRNWDIT